jgi:predicted AAA+ superfamily ATPase
VNRVNRPSPIQVPDLSKKNSHNPTSQSKHECSHFGNFAKGAFKEVNQNEPVFKIGLLDQPVFVGRQKDMFKLITKLLSPKSSRLLTLLGLPGIGKSSLVRKTIQHINERALLPGGYILLNIRGIKDCEVFMRTFNNQMVAGDT